VRTITAPKRTSKFAQSQRPSVSPAWLDYGIQTHSITASECISKFTQLWFGEMVALAWPPKRIGEKERL
jgi:hypothetical protein